MSIEPSDAGAAPILTVGEEDEEPPLEPIYSALTKRATAIGGNLSCSGSKEFCFLCNFSSSEDCDVDIKSHIDLLASQGQEVSQIAKAVKVIYDEHVRDTVVFERSDGSVVDRPEWSVESIRRHLLLSPEYERVFQDYSHFLFKSVILRQADTIVNGDTGRVDEKATKSLLATLRQYSDFRAKGTPALKRQCRSVNETPM